jgi:hypothetical protein
VIALALLLAALPQATPPGVQVKANPETVSLGDPIQVEVSIDHDPRDVYSLPGVDPAPLAWPGPPSVVVSRAQSGERARTTFRFTLANYGTLQPRLPDLTLSVAGPDGARELHVIGRALRLRSLVQEEAQGSPERAHHGPKPPVPLLVRSWLWLMLAGGLAAAVLGVVWLRSRPARAPAPPPSLPAWPDDEAMARLEALKGSAPWREGRGRAGIFALSEIVRTYVGKRFSFDAMDLTTDELLEELRRRRLLGIDFAELSEEARWEDLVKFAKMEPSEEECLRSIDRAVALVQHTRVVRREAAA